VKKSTLYARFAPVACCLLATCLPMRAAVINFYYTTLGNPDVFSATYNTVGGAITSTAIGFSNQGADGILPGPTVGGNPTLFFGGESGQTVYQITTTGTNVSNSNVGINAYLLAENPQANTLFVLNNAGSITTLPITGGGTIGSPDTVHTVTGTDTNISDLVWGMNPVGPIFYITGQEGGNGNLGTLNGTTYATTQLFSNIPTAQDAVFDPFTGLIVLFGEGEIDTFNPVTMTLGTAQTLPGTCTTNALTVGSVDGAGHALVENCGTLVYINYSGTGNILTGTTASEAYSLKDLVLFPSTPPAQTPEPSTIALAMSGVAFLVVRKWRRS